MARGDGKTHLTLVGAWQGTGVAAAQGAARGYEVTQADRLLLAVRQELANQFEVFGELGRGDRGRIVYLARELTSAQLVALLLVPDESVSGGATDFEVQIVRRLDASIPAAESECPRCHKSLRGWGRFCRHCGANLSGIPERDDPASREQLLQALRAATRGRYDILGEMSNAEGDGVVFFARDARSAGGLVALRVLRETANDGVDEYSVGVTQLFGRMAESIMSPPTPIPDAPPVEAEIRQAPPTTPQVFDPPPVVTPPPVEPKPKLDERKRVAILAGGATLAAVALIVLVSSLNRKQTSDGAVTRPDSVDVQLGGALPPGVKATIDSQPLLGLARVLPGPHVLQASAPGYVTVTQPIDLRPGQSMLWVPALVKETPPPATKARVTPPPARPAVPRPQPPQVSTVTCASIFARLEWSRALKPCEDEATRGSTASQRALATMYERGLGVDVDLARALEWYRKAADGGDAFAQYRLGAMYMSGSGVKKDERVGLDWYHRAADQGQTDALLALANATERGQGVRRDKNEAFRLYLRAAELGDVRAEDKVASSYASGDGVSRDEAQAAEWFRKAAEKGDAEAQYRLGDMYARGAGVSKSDSLARVWYAKAAAKGHERARAALK